jgi:hypothetical protein
MRQYIGDGWYIEHLTERTLDLKKESYEYRRFTGRDGTVRIRAEPGMDRAKIIERAIIMAKRSDAELAQRVLERMVPSDHNLRRFREQSRLMARAFGTREEPEFIGRKRV